MKRCSALLVFLLALLACGLSATPLAAEICLEYNDTLEPRPLHLQSGQIERHVGRLEPVQSLEEVLRGAGD